MKNNQSIGSQIKSAALITLPFLALASASFGATVSCQVSGATSVVVTDSQIAGAPIAAAGGATPDDFATLNGEASPGCSTVDLTFSNLSSTINAVAMNSGTYISTLSNQQLSSGAEDIIFSNVRGTDSQGPPIAPNGDFNDGTNDWDAARKASTVITTNYQVNVLGVVSSFVLNLNGVSTGQGNGSSVTGTTLLCLGGTWTGSTCSAGAAHIVTITLVNGTNTYTQALGGSFNLVGVQNNFTIAGGNAGNGNGPGWLTSFDEDFSGADSPEPATFGLMGAALAGLAAVGYRRSKTKS